MSVGVRRPRVPVPDTRGPSDSGLGPGSGRVRPTHPSRDAPSVPVEVDHGFGLRRLGFNKIIKVLWTCDRRVSPEPTPNSRLARDPGSDTWYVYWT